MVQAELWQRDDLENIVRSAKTFLDRARQNRRFWLKAKASPRLNEFRQRVFPEAEASASLQSLGLRWLLDRGVAIVFNGMRRPAYVKEAVDLLRGL